MQGHRVIAGIAALALALPVAALAQSGGYPPPGGTGSGGGGEPADVEAQGNPFTGGLAFEPSTVTVKVGEVVRWTNTDFLVPHTATEDHFLWQLSGDYGFPIEGFHGFGPDDTRQRRFEAGTHQYFCEVHGKENQSGTVRVPVTLREGRGSKVLAIWSKRELPEGQVFDVQRRRGGGQWRTALDGTRRLRKAFPGGEKGTVWRFRARLRESGDQSQATDYSPPARIKVG